MKKGATACFNTYQAVTSSSSAREKQPGGFQREFWWRSSLSTCYYSSVTAWPIPGVGSYGLAAARNAVLSVMVWNLFFTTALCKSCGAWLQRPVLWHGIELLGCLQALIPKLYTVGLKKKCALTIKQIRYYLKMQWFIIFCSLLASIMSHVSLASYNILFVVIVINISG